MIIEASKVKQNEHDVKVFFSILGWFPAETGDISQKGAEGKR